MSNIPCVMIVDDNPGDIGLLQIAFEINESAVSLVTVDGGEAAIAWLTQVEPANPLPNLMLLDLNMPRKNGFDVLTFLRGLPAFMRLPVVVLTSSNAPADRTRALALGAQEFMVKPQTLDDFLLLIDRLKPYLRGGTAAFAKT